MAEVFKLTRNNYASHIEKSNASEVEKARMLAAIPRSDPISYQAVVSTTGFIFWERVYGYIKVNDKDVLTFTGDAGGVGLAFGGQGWGTVLTAVPYENIPKGKTMSFELTIATAYVQLNVFDEGKLKRIN